MSDKPLTRLFVADFLAQTLIALCIGLAAGIVLAGVTLLLAAGS